jgi:hypothetical protein
MLWSETPMHTHPCNPTCCSLGLESAGPAARSAVSLDEIKDLGRFNPQRMPRYCQHIPDEFKASYASVLVHGPDPATLRLREAVRDRITSCFTTWCPDCSGCLKVEVEVEVQLQL